MLCSAFVVNLYVQKLRCRSKPVQDAEHNRRMYRQAKLGDRDRREAAAARDEPFCGTTTMVKVQELQIQVCDVSGECFQDVIVLDQSFTAYVSAESEGTDSVKPGQPCEEGGMKGRSPPVDELDRLQVGKEAWKVKGE